jgi:hypothetical protein
MYIYIILYVIISICIYVYVCDMPVDLNPLSSALGDVPQAFDCSMAVPYRYEECSCCQYSVEATWMATSTWNIIVQTSPNPVVFLFSMWVCPVVTYTSNYLMLYRIVPCITMII